MENEFIPISGPSITQREIDYVTDAAANAWYENCNVYHERFERAFAEFVGKAYAVALPSCTSAIHLSLAAMGIGPGDEVIVPEITWIATAAPISYVGATPVFADIDPQTWCLSPESLAEKITPRTRAVIPVDIYGGVCDWDAIRSIADANGLAVIEDAAEAIGSRYHDRPAGSLGDTGVFSFHGSKTMTTGEGGMLVTDDAELHQRVLFLRDHGRAPGETQFYNTEVAFKYKMSAMQAAMGLAQIERIDELVSRKREIFEWYRHELADQPGLQLNAQPPGTLNTYWMVTVILDEQWGIAKEPLMQEMQASNIAARPFFRPLSSLPAYANLPRRPGENPTAYSIAPRGMHLPCGMTITREQVQRVCRTLLQAIDKLQK